MVLRMPRPVLIGKIFYYRQRVPKDLVRLVGTKIIKESLKTEDPHEAMDRFMECARKYRAYWEHVRRTPIPTGEDIAALAGEVYREFYNRWRDHNKNFWMAHHWAMRRWQLSVATDNVDPMAPLPNEAEAMITLERDAGEALDTVLKRAGMVVSAEVRGFLLRKVGTGVLLAMERISREIEGDYRPDDNEKRFPPFVPPQDAEERSPLAEFVFAAGKQGWKSATVYKYRHALDDFLEQLPGYGLRRIKGDWDLSRIEQEHVRKWAEGLVKRKAGEATALTIEREYLDSLKAIFTFAKKNGRIKQNPAEGIKLQAARKLKGKTMRGFLDNEAEAILADTLMPQGDRPARKTLAARRWGPWLCAYTGARIVEIMQLRGMDVRRQDGLWCIRITPEAGTQKSDEQRDVPLHEHLIAQGFVEFAGLHRPEEPPFHNYEPGHPDELPPGVDLAEFDDVGTPQEYHRMRATKAAQSVGGNLSKWVRSLGLLDPEAPVDPNHGWRHFFKSKGIELQLREVVLDGIQGHAAPGAAGRYKHFPPRTMMQEISKLPRIAVEAPPWMDNPEANPWLPPNYAQALRPAKAPPQSKRTG